MSTKQTLRGFATISYWADDMEAAKAWYSELLGSSPYFERSGPDGQLAYAEFRLGDYQHDESHGSGRVRTACTSWRGIHHGFRHGSIW
ncbi:MAG: Glyoxalase/bleomycin resistance protein/dioxygenase [Paenibacillus sp.]|nr:Glyoxalase/bleomycin resistance protein/dioxygenase [Paenibacillus sp.]